MRHSTSQCTRHSWGTREAAHAHDAIPTRRPARWAPSFASFPPVAAAGRGAFGLVWFIPCSPLRLGVVLPIVAEAGRTCLSALRSCRHRGARGRSCCSPPSSRPAHAHMRTRVAPYAEQCACTREWTSAKKSTRAPPCTLFDEFVSDHLRHLVASNEGMRMHAGRRAWQGVQKVLLARPGLIHPRKLVEPN